MNCCKHISLSLLCLLIAFSSFRNERERYGETIITQRGDEVTFSKPKEREVIVRNVNTKRTIATERSVPALLNGKRIYDLKKYPDVDRTKDSTKFLVTQHTYELLHNALANAISKEMGYLANGNYICELNNVVVDENGFIAYYESKGLLKHIFDGNPFNKPRTQPINSTSTYIIKRIIDNQVNKLQFRPLAINGDATPYLTRFTFYFHQFQK
ncbi:MAG: hypothetical protein H3C54_03645 [Taibaiella sp.]|nr:hypothetical protein [Taibaiella sp.]